MSPRVKKVPRSFDPAKLPAKTDERRAPPQRSKTIDQKKWRFAREYVLGAFAGQPGKCYQVSHCEPDDRGFYPPLTQREHSSGSALLRVPIVQREIEKNRRELIQQEDLTPANHLADLRRIRDLAIETGDLKSAVKAEEIRGKAAGFHIERHQHLHANVSETEVVGELARLIKSHPELADMFQQELEGLPVEVEAVETADASDTENAGPG